MKKIPQISATTVVLLLATTVPSFAQVDAGRSWMQQTENPKQLGLQLLEEGDLIQAKEVLERAELAAPNDPQVLRALARTYYLIGLDNLQNGAAVEGSYYMERAVEKDPRLADGWLGLGKSRYLEGDLDGAVNALTKAESLGSAEAKTEMVRVRTTRASRRIDLSELAGAESDVQEALKRAPGDHEALLALGRLRLTQERPAEAVDPLKQAAADERFFGPARVLLALAYEAQKMWSLAIAAADDVDAMEAHKPDADQIRARSYYNWALDAYNAEQWADAESRFFTSSEYAADWDDPIFGGALARIRQDNGEGAKEVLDPLYARRPDYPGIRSAIAEAEHSIGRHLAAAGKYAEAVAMLEHAFEMDPNQPEILLTLGSVEEMRQGWPAALAAYELALRAGADQVSAHRGAMRVLQDHLDRWLDALPHAEAILAINAEDEDARTRVINITRAEGLKANESGSDQLAIQLLDRHRDFNADDSEINFALATSLVRMMQFGRALPLIEPLYASAPDDQRYADVMYDTRVGLGDEATLTRRWDNARVQYEAALEIKPDIQIVRFRYGGALLALDQYPQATTAFRTVWDTTPGLRERTARPLAMSLTGWSGQELAASPERAIELAAEAIERDKTFPGGFLARSRGYEALKDLDRAIPDAEKYYAMLPEDPEGEAWLVGLHRRGTMVAMDEQRYPVAEQRARRLLELRPADFDGTYWLARALFAQDRWEEARPYFAKAAADGPYRGDAYVYLARGHAANGRPERAAKYYLAARRLKSSAASVTEQVDTFFAAAEVAEKDSRNDDVVKYYNYAFLLQPKDPEVAYRLGKALMRVDRYADSIPHLRRAFGSWPQRRDVAFDFAESLVKVDKPLLGVSVLTPWESPDRPGHEEARARIGQAYYQATRSEYEAGQLAQAATHGLAAAERLDPDPEPWYLLGQVRYDQNQFDGALTAFNRVYELKPDLNDTVVYLSNIHTRRGLERLRTAKLDEARVEFETALKYAPNIDAWYGQLLLAEAERQPNAMMRLADKIEAETPGYRDVTSKRAAAARMLGESFLEMGDYPVAVSYFSKMLEYDPSAFDAYYYLGAVAVRQKRFTVAVSHLETAGEKLGGEFKNLRTMLVKTYAAEAQRLINSQEIDEAMDLIDKSLELDSNQPELLIWRGSIYEQQEDWEQARAAYESARKLPGTNDRMKKVIDAMISNLPDYLD